MSESWEEGSSLEGAAKPVQAVEPTAESSLDPIDEKVAALALDNPAAEAPADEPSTPLADDAGETFSDAGDDEEEKQDRLLKHMNIVFIGHVDAGKSTISGQIMYLTGSLDDRTLEKFEREAKAKNRESWKFAWALDTTDQERAKGKTEEYGRGYFKTGHKRFTILDAPGHRNFVPHMIGGASQAEIGVLVISAKRGEFEAGFEKGGQTREHALLAKTVGIRQLIVVINKMDDSTVEWAKERYDECVNKLTPYLKQVGWSTKDVHFMPLSGLTGINMKERVPKSTCPWWDGMSFFEFLDNMKPPERLLDAPLRMPINNKFRDMGTVIMGKVEAGIVKKGDIVMVMPNKVEVEVVSLAIESHDIHMAEPGDNVKLRVKGIEEEDIRVGFCVCSREKPVAAVRVFDAQVIILEHKSIICAGYQAVLHIHAAVEECMIEELLALVDKKTGKTIQKRPKFVKPGQTMLCRISISGPICIEKYKDFQQLGRFMLRDEGRTVGVGVITELNTGTKKDEE